MAVLIMAAGVLAGYFLLPERWMKKAGKLNSGIQLVLIGILIFSMGVMLGSRKGFFRDFFTYGFQSVVLAVLAVSASVGVVLLFHKLSARRSKETEE